MRRYAGQRPLYEAWNRSRSKPKRVGLLERLRPQLEKLRKSASGRPHKQAGQPKPVAEEPAPAVLKPPKPVERPESPGPRPAQTWLTPKAIQLNAGRIEVSLPYQIGIAIGLLVVLLLLVAFRLGQMDQRSRYARNDPSVRSASVDAGVPASGSEPSPDGSVVSGGAATSAAAHGDHWIVLAYHPRYEDVAAAKQYFAEHGIATAVYAVKDVRRNFADRGMDTGRLPSGEGYLLVTSIAKLYDNPEKPGTDGYAVLEKIRQIGAGYKDVVPPGLDSFAPNYFSDAYGMKIR